MSAREKVYGIISDLSEEQLTVLAEFLDTFVSKSKKEKKSAKSLIGIFNDAAAPDMIPCEKEAWAEAAVEKHIRFLEEMNNENT